MTEDDARRLLLVRAVEIEDASALLLTREDRQQAMAAGLSRRAGEVEGKRADDAFLAGRADFAFSRLAARLPAVERARQASRWPKWVNWAIPCVAVALGLATNEISSGRRLNLIAFPLIGMLAWNLIVYGLLIAHGVRSLARHGSSQGGAGRLSRLAAWSSGLSRLASDAHQPLGRALGRFAADWIRHAARLNGARTSRTLHLGAAAFAIGVITGMYLRALGVEYRAGWESTFLNASAVQRLLTLALGPASSVTGIALPGPEHLATLRWSAGAGENAGPWIHLYAATALLFILLPRLLLAAAGGLTAMRLHRRFPVPGREDFHIRRLLRSAHGGSAEVRVVPYSFRPPEPTRRALDQLLSAALGDGARVTFDTPVPYGEEEEWLARGVEAEDADYLIILFNLASTPESENHGALVAGVRQALHSQRSGTVLTILVDESAYRERLTDQASAEVRIGTRRTAWERMLAGVGTQPLFADLAHDEDPALVRLMEGALVEAPNLLSAKAARK